MRSTPLLAPNLTGTVLTGTVLAATVLAAIAASTRAGAGPAAPPGTRRHIVEITNVTRGQIFAPVLVASHDEAASLFELGSPALPELAHQAEEGDPSQLAGYLGMSPNVLDVRTSMGLLMPGQTASVVVVTDDQHPYVSLTGMLVSTNDAFVGLRSVRAPLVGEDAHLALAYDAGSEANSEDCAFIPGPPCGSAGMHDPAPAEGYVHVHAGVHGGAGLDPAEHDWRGPVAEVRVRRFLP